MSKSCGVHASQRLINAVCNVHYIASKAATMAPTTPTTGLVDPPVGIGFWVGTGAVPLEKMEEVVSITTKVDSEVGAVVIVSMVVNPVLVFGITVSVTVTGSLVDDVSVAEVDVWGTGTEVDEGGITVEVVVVFGSKLYQEGGTAYSASGQRQAPSGGNCPPWL